MFSNCNSDLKNKMKKQIRDINDNAFENEEKKDDYDFFDFSPPFYFSENEPIIQHLFKFN